MLFRRMTGMPGYPWLVIGAIMVILSFAGTGGETTCQVLAQDTPSSIESLGRGQGIDGGRQAGKGVPFAHYEDRLRQSERWRSMSEQERQEALQKIENLRMQFLERQKQLHSQYGQMGGEATKKKRDSLMSRRRKMAQYQEETLWERFQALPLRRRLEIEKDLGLEKTVPSQRQKKFEEVLQRLPYSRQQALIRELELSAR